MYSIVTILTVSLFSHEGGTLSQLVEQFAGSQESLQSAAGEEQEQEMEEMTGVLDNDMEPLDSTSGVVMHRFG